MKKIIFLLLGLFAFLAGFASAYSCDQYEYECERYGSCYNFYAYCSSGSSYSYNGYEWEYDCGDYDYCDNYYYRQKALYDGYEFSFTAGRLVPQRVASDYGGLRSVYYEPDEYLNNRVVELQGYRYPYASDIMISSNDAYFQDSFRGFHGRVKAQD